MLQILYLKHRACKPSWIRNLPKYMKIWSLRKLMAIEYGIKSYTTIKTPYNWPAFLTASCLNALIQIN